MLNAVFGGIDLSKLSLNSSKSLSQLATFELWCYLWRLASLDVEMDLLGLDLDLRDKLVCRCRRVWEGTTSNTDGGSEETSNVHIDEASGSETRENLGNLK